MAEELSFSLDPESFDTGLLPAEARERGSQAFQDAVRRYFQQAYRRRGGRVDVAFHAGRIEVSWSGQAEQQDALSRAVALLEQGRRDEARPLLETLIQLEPGNSEALYNLGLLCSDAGELERARELLQRCVAADPATTNAWVALGVAALRGGDIPAALPPLERAVEQEPANPFACAPSSSSL